MMDNSQPTENRWNQIDRYVNGKMPDRERDSFEQRMREHAGLAQQVHLHRDILAGMEYHFAQQLKEQLALSDQVKPKFNVARALWIAATVLLVVGAVGAAYYYLLRPADPQQLAVAYFEAYPNTLTQISRSDALGDSTSGEDTAEAISSVMNYYETGSYSRAIAGFNKLLAVDSVADQRTALVFYRGIAYLGAGRPAEAADDFLAITQQSDTLLTEPAQWYLGLSRLQRGQVAEAKQIFVELRSSGGNYAEAAAKLLDELG